MSTPTKTYLGDGVYAELEMGMIKITTDDGIEETNTIFLEPATLNALNQYAGRIRNLSQNADTP